jgi:hypothetical protein
MPRGRPEYVETEMLVARRNKADCVTLRDRLEAGNLSIPEVCLLRNTSRSQFYRDLKIGLVSVEKVGRKSIVRGPVARAYIALEPDATIKSAEASGRSRATGNELTT